MPCRTLAFHLCQLHLMTDVIVERDRDKGREGEGAPCGMGAVFVVVVVSKGVSIVLQLAWETAKTCAAHKTMKASYNDLLYKPTS